MKLSRQQFILGAGAFAVMPLSAADGSALKTPLLLETKRMALNDGPGIRTTFFVKGCPLHCIWCHNPESINPKAQLARFRHLCQNCPSGCTGRETTCPTRALRLFGKPQTMEEIVAKALEDRPFYASSGGGVTLSGGEPLFFWEWTAELLRRFKAEGLHTALDTSLYAPPAAIEAVRPFVDLWLADYKADDDVRHRKYTGVSNEPIRRNLEALVVAKAEIEVRCLVVPGCTDGEDLERRHRYLASLGLTGRKVVDLEYHDSARSKYAALGIPDTLP